MCTKIHILMQQLQHSGHTAYIHILKMGSIILLQEGMTQGDNAAMAVYAIST